MENHISKDHKIEKREKVLEGTVNKNENLKTEMEVQKQNLNKT